MIKAIDITRALAIEGFMSEQELVWLAIEAAKHKLIVEIGSYLGRSTRALLDHTDGMVYAFDDWKGPRDIYLSKEERLEIPNKFFENLKDHIADLSGKLCTFPGEVEETYVLRGIQQLTPDMIFIDGEHEYSSVKRDIEFWKSRIQKGGLLCGHDANWDSVSQAVRESLGEVEIVDSTTIWFKEMQ